MIINIPNVKAPTWNKIIQKTAHHWAVKKKEFDYWKTLIYWIVKRLELEPYKNKVHLTFECHYKDKRRRDPDGICLKPIIDALVDTGLLKDDSDEYISSIKIKVKRSSEDMINIKIKGYE